MHDYFRRFSCNSLIICLKLLSSFLSERKEEIIPEDYTSVFYRNGDHTSFP